MIYEKLKYLVAQQVSGTITPSEKAELLQLLNTPESTALFSKLLDELSITVPLRVHPTANAAQIFESITGLQQQEQRPLKRIKPVYYYAAASVLLIILATAFFFQSKTVAPRQTTNTLVKAAPQQQKYLMLSDSSLVILNEGATLAYRSFTDKSREVQLTGEAFFEIKHDPQRPFIVHTGRVKTTVLGTAFNIKADATSPITVTVTRGKVKVEDGIHPVALLTPNQQVTVDTLSGKSNNSTVDASSITSWNRQGLKFDDSPLEEVALAIEMRFKRPVLFSDSTLKYKHVTAEFERDESMENILNVITKVNRMQYTMDMDKIVIGHHP